MPDADDPRAFEVLRFWFAEDGSPRKQWFEKDPAFDAQVRERFLALYEEAAAGRLARWKQEAADCLALIVLLDQFPRNMFRGSGRAFATDPLAREAAMHAIGRGHDRALSPLERMFVYLPLEHSESLQDQVRCCNLMRSLEEFPETRDAHQWALKHHDIILRFGRFPHRNALLGRASTPAEVSFLKQPGSSF